jgi:hypothetical protein
MYSAVHIYYTTRKIGGGDHFSCSWAGEEATVNTIKQFEESTGHRAPFAFCQKAALTVGKPDQNRKRGKSPHFVCVPSTVENMTKRHGYQSTKAQSSSKKKPKMEQGSPEVTQELVVKFLYNVYEWRQTFAWRHYQPSPYPCENPYQWAAYAYSMTIDRIFNYDEIPMALFDEKQKCTVALRTCSNGTIKGILVVFGMTSQPVYAGEPGLVDVEGFPFFVAHNDNHWNNSILNFLWYHYQTRDTELCSCGYAGCCAYLEVFDNFSGHFSDPMFDTMEATGHQPAVCPDTTRTQPNDNNFHATLQREFKDAASQIFFKHTSVSQRLMKQDGEEPLSKFTEHEKRQLNLYIIWILL